MKPTHFFALSALTLGICLPAGADQDFRQRANSAAIQTVTDSDIQAEVEFGRNVSARILGRIHLYDNPALTEYINLVGQSLASHANRPELFFRFAVLDASFANAYSAPGGYIFITRGAIELMEDESELAAVLAHEIAHITERHIVESFKIKGKDTDDVTGVTRILSGGKDSAGAAVLQALDQAVEMLFDSGYQHADELESDATAVIMLASSGYDVNALQRYLSRINKGTKKPEKTTHPLNKERFTAIKQLIKEEGLRKFKGATAKSRFEKYSQ